MREDIVVVCTANVARSPLLALRLQATLDAAVGRGTLSVGSAGTDARYGQPAAMGSRHVAEQWGSSLDEHIARPLAYVGLAEAALVLPMTRAHERAVIAHEPLAAPRTIRVRELLTLLDAPRHIAGIDGFTDPADPASRLAATVTALSGLRRRRGRRRHLDVPDPLGADQDAFDRLGAEFADAAARIAVLALSAAERS